MAVILNRRPSLSWEHVRRILMELDVQEKSTGEAWGLSHCQMSFTSKGYWIIILMMIKLCQSKYMYTYMFMHFYDTLVLVITAGPE